MGEQFTKPEAPSQQRSGRGRHASSSAAASDRQARSPKVHPNTTGDYMLLKFSLRRVKKTISTIPHLEGICRYLLMDRKFNAAQETFQAQRMWRQWVDGGCDLAANERQRFTCRKLTSYLSNAKLAFHPPPTVVITEQCNTTHPLPRGDTSGMHDNSPALPPPKKKVVKAEPYHQKQNSARS